MIWPPPGSFDQEQLIDQMLELFDCLLLARMFQGQHCSSQFRLEFNRTIITYSKNCATNMMVERIILKGKCQNLQQLLLPRLLYSGTPGTDGDGFKRG